MEGFITSSLLLNSLPPSCQGLYPVFSANASLAEPIIDILVGHVCTIKVLVLLYYGDPLKYYPA